MSSFNKNVNDIFEKMYFSKSEHYKRPQSNFLITGFIQQMKRKLRPKSFLKRGCLSILDP